MEEWETDLFQVHGHVLEPEDGRVGRGQQQPVEVVGRLGGGAGAVDEAGLERGQRPLLGRCLGAPLPALVAPFGRRQLLAACVCRQLAPLQSSW